MVISQERPVDRNELLAEHKRARSVYDQATALGSSENYDEAKEKELNLQALDLFANLLRRIPEKQPGFDSILFLS